MTKRALKYGATGTGYISTPSFAIPDTGILTVEVWMKSIINATNAQNIIGGGNSSATVGYISLRRWTGSNTLLCYYADGTSNNMYISIGNFFTNFDNQWIHVAIVYDYTNKTLKGYRNGAQFNATANLTGTPIFPLTNNVKYIGAYIPTYSRITDGSLDEVRIYNRGLGADEIYQHYLGNYADDTGLQLCYSGVDGTGTTVVDSSGNGRNGTMYNDVTWEDMPLIVKGGLTSTIGLDNIIQ